MKKYENPFIRISAFQRENILTTSATKAVEDATAAAVSANGESKVITVTF